MTYSIWKFPCPAPGAESVVNVPTNREWLTAQMQGNTLMAWALVRVESPTENVQLRTIGTGWDLETYPGDHIGTVQVGPLVWHVFEEPKP